MQTSYKSSVGEVTLFPFNGSHLAKTTKWFRDKAVLDGLLKHKMESDLKLKIWVKNFYNRPQSKHFAIYNGNTHIGNVGLRNISGLENTAEVLIYLGASRSMGLGSEAFKMFLSYCFGVRMMKRLYITVGRDNKIARKMYRNHGFLTERIFKGAFYDGRNYIDVIKMSMKKEDWHAKSIGEKDESRSQEKVPG